MQRKKLQPSQLLNLEVPRGESPTQRTPDETSQGSLEDDLTTTSTSKADRVGQRLAQKEEIAQSTKECLDMIELIQQEGQALVQQLRTRREKETWPQAKRQKR